MRIYCKSDNSLKKRKASLIIKLTYKRKLLIYFSLRFHPEPSANITPKAADGVVCLWWVCPPWPRASFQGSGDVFFLHSLPTTAEETCSVTQRIVLLCPPGSVRPLPPSKWHLPPGEESLGRLGSRGNKFPPAPIGQCHLYPLTE